jgi:hypothetical protein
MKELAQGAGRKAQGKVFKDFTLRRVSCALHHFFIVIFFTLIIKVHML